ncbi:MAG: serine/threonine protein kinase [Alphaproteobacteria bacterium]|nr:serine/threonine protein kinase [Alphaproteobacteria bacterium]
MRAAPRRYVVQHPIGRGAFGTVYRAQMIGEGGFRRDVAIKLMNPNVEHPEEMARRQRDEARLLGLIRHRAILQVDGLVRLGGTWAVVMEHIDGVNLRQLVRGGAVPPSVALTIVSEVAGALAVAWDAPGADGAPLHIVHRDIKPANIQLTAAGEVKLLDFGVARADFESRETASVGLILGTVRYMSPERFEGIDGPEGDVYALGIVLAELLTARDVKGNARGDRRIPEVLEELEAELGAAGAPLVELVDRCVASEPSQRPTAGELERLAWDLAATCGEPRIQDWSRIRVREIQALQSDEASDDPLVGETLIEQSETIAVEGPSSSMVRTVSLAVGGMTVVGMGLVIVALTLLVGVVAWLATRPPTTTPAPPVRVEVPVLEAGETLSAPRVLVEQVEVAAPEPMAVRTTVPVPAPAVAPQPPEPAAAPAVARVVVQGDAKDVVLSGPNGRFRAPGEVPPGVYDVVYQDAVVEGLRGTTLSAGQSLTLKCNATFLLCTR